MIRGTTPTLQFEIPYTADLIAGGYITFKQNYRNVLDINVLSDQVTIEDNLVTLDLTQKQTLQFDPKQKCEVQIRFKMLSGKATASYCVDVPIDKVLKEGEI